ncbi:MAG: TetR/AcrR family transcriptional regulator [Myxococcales bacterium]|nr:TetR/AcrR family transcriptional regulator [Myxococcales bacterium]
MGMKDSAACRRRLILAAAERLLGHYGPSKTTVADIARAAEVGVGTIYLEFPSKDAILIALSEQRYAAILAAMEAAATSEAPHAERLRLLLERRVDGFLALAEHGEHAVDLVHCGACPAIRSARVDFETRERALLEGLLRDGAAAGAFTCDDAPATIAAAILQAFTAFAPPVLYARPAEQVRAELAILHRLLLVGLARR